MELQQLIAQKNFLSCFFFSQKFCICFPKNLVFVILQNFLANQIPAKFRRKSKNFTFFASKRNTKEKYVFSFPKKWKNQPWCKERRVNIKVFNIFIRGVLRRKLIFWIWVRIGQQIFSVHVLQNLWPVVKSNIECLAGIKQRSHNYKY